MSNLRDELLKLCKINPDIRFSLKSFESMCKARAKDGHTHVFVKVPTMNYEASKAFAESHGLRTKCFGLFNDRYMAISWADEPKMMVPTMCTYELTQGGHFNML